MNKHFHRCVFTDGVEYSLDLLSLARKQKILTFNTDFLNPDYVQGPMETPFIEIGIAYPEEVYSHPILDRQAPFHGTYEQFIHALKDALKAFLMTFDDKEKYLILHSSGMDSRFISGTMAEMRREGKRFDNVHFRCHQPECEAFLEIMKKEGWPESQYSCYPGREKDYYDIGRDDICAQGWCSYSNQMNFWSDIIQDPKEWIVITGEGGKLFKYISKYKESPFPYTDNYCLNMLIEHNPGKGEWDNQFSLYWKDLIMPLWSFEYLSVSTRVPFQFVKGDPKTGWDNIRTDLVKSVGLDGFQYTSHNYNWSVSPARLKCMEDQFYGGKFYRKFYPNLPVNIDFSKPTGWESKLWGFAVTLFDKI